MALDPLFENSIEFHFIDISIYTMIKLFIALLYLTQQDLVDPVSFPNSPNCYVGSIHYIVN